MNIGSFIAILVGNRIRIKDNCDKEGQLENKSE